MWKFLDGTLGGSGLLRTGVPEGGERPECRVVQHSGVNKYCDIPSE